MRLAIIPARGGSKRIPRKNIRSFRGRPILHWSIQSALDSGLFDEVMVSTEDEEIAETARAGGASIPFLRSAATSNDHATTAAVLEEVLLAYQDAGRSFEFACSLYPTAPLVTPEDLREGYRRLVESDFDVILPVVAFGYPIWRSLRRLDDGRIELNFPENLNARSQDLPEAYHDAGQWCWFRARAFLDDRRLLGPKTGSVLIPADRVQDIDNETDWRLAELKHERLFG